MLAHQFQAKAVQGADVGRLEQGELLLPPESLGLPVGFLLEPLANPLPHFGCGRFVEGLLGGGLQQSLVFENVAALLAQPPDCALDRTGDRLAGQLLPLRRDLESDQAHAGRHNRVR